MVNEQQVTLMIVKRPLVDRTLRAVFLALALTLSTSNGWAAVLYASYNDHTGFTRPDTIEKFDTATGADLGPFAAHTGLSLPNGLAFDTAGNLYVANYVENLIPSASSEHFP